MLFHLFSPKCKMEFSGVYMTWDNIIPLIPNEMCAYICVFKISAFVCEILIAVTHINRSSDMMLILGFKKYPIHVPNKQLISGP